MSERETDFPREVLNELGIKNLEGALATPSALGMMLKPHEFQRIMLVNTGHGDAADMMDRDRLVFRPSSGMMQPCQSLGADHIIEDLLRAIMPFLESRSYLEPVVKRRIIRIRIIKPVEQKFELADNLPLLSKISAAYNWYRDEAVKMATMAPQIISSRPDIQAAVLGLTDHDIFTKQAISPEAASIIGAVPLSLMGSAHYRGEMEQGKPVGMVGRVMAEHPGMSAVGSALMARQLARTNIGKNLIEGVLDTGRQLIGPKA